MAEEQDVDMPSALSAAAQSESVDDFAFELPAELLDVSFVLPDEPKPTPAEDPEPPPKPKKPRKKKSKNRPAMPVLRSSRGRDLKTTARYSNAKFKADEKPWTVPERKRLLAALKAHGSSDINKLSEAVRTRSVAAVSHFLLERRRLKDRIVIQGPAGNRAAYATRILRRALNVVRRRYDRSKLLPQVVAACERQPFPEPTEDSTGELPQFEDLYQMIREVMENHVPAALGDCELWLMHRLLWTIGNMMKTLDLDASKEALYQALRWAAAQPADGYSKPAGQNEEQCQGSPSEDTMRRYLNFPTIKERKDGLRSSWNPLRMPTNVIQAPWAAIQEYLAQNASRRECVNSLLPSTSSATAAMAARKKTDLQSLESFHIWKN
ncbi:uncharacterized protein LOC119174208 [Rhipicephalus microplus]|uniref:uncharacterized protein LOC119174208 n=1 Tax=Rhipicephalus microplus TaxID=6941 RepID=UPI003F6C173B